MYTVSTELAGFNDCMRTSNTFQVVLLQLKIHKPTNTEKSLHILESKEVEKQYTYVHVKFNMMIDIYTCTCSRLLHLFNIDLHVHVHLY